jgi:ABC-2 type transport system permease protein
MFTGLTKLTFIELKLLLREPVTIVFTFAFPLTVFFVLAEVFGGESPEDLRQDWRGLDPKDYYVPAYIAIVIAALAFISMPVHVASYREAGVLRRFRASSLGLWTFVGSQIVVLAILSLAGGAVIVIAGWLFYGAGLPEQPVQLAIALTVSILGIAGISLLLGSVFSTARATQGAGLILFFAMMMTSGGGPPRQAMSQTLQDVTNAFPLTHVVTALQDTWHDFGWAWESQLVVAVIGAACFAVAVRRFRWE